MNLKREGFPTGINTEKEEPFIPKEEQVTLSTPITTSQLKKTMKKEHIKGLKSEIQELQVLERFIKTKNESLKEHSSREMDENDKMEKENEQLKGENWLTSGTNSERV